MIANPLGRLAVVLTGHNNICVIGELKIGGRRESQICVAFFKDRTGRKSASSAISAWLSSRTEQVENLRHLRYLRDFLQRPNRSKICVYL